MKVQGDRLLVVPFGAGHDEEGNIVFPEDEGTKGILIPDTVEEDPRDQSNKFVVIAAGIGELVQKLDPVPEKGDYIYLPNPMKQSRLPVVTIDKNYLIVTPDQVIHIEKT